MIDDPVNNYSSRPYCLAAAPFLPKVFLGMTKCHKQAVHPPTRDKHRSHVVRRIQLHPRGRHAPRRYTRRSRWPPCSSTCTRSSPPCTSTQLISSRLRWTAGRTWRRSTARTSAATMRYRFCAICPTSAADHRSTSTTNARLSTIRPSTAPSSASII